jgi:hypothetical protein
VVQQPQSLPPASAPSQGISPGAGGKP